MSDAEVDDYLAAVPEPQRSTLGRLRAVLAALLPDAEQGIQLVTVGVGMGNYNDVLLEQLADKGDGFYAYVNQLDDARTHAADEEEPLIVGLVVFDTALAAEVRLDRLTAPHEQTRLVTIETLAALATRAP